MAVWRKQYEAEPVKVMLSTAASTQDRGVDLSSSACVDSPLHIAIGYTAVIAATDLFCSRNLAIVIVPDTQPEKVTSCCAAQPRCMAKSHSHYDDGFNALSSRASQPPADADVERHVLCAAPPGLPVPKDLQIAPDHTTRSTARMTSHNTCQHNKNVCHKMLNGKTCENPGCISSQLCHVPECCRNIVRARCTHKEKRLAKENARLADEELRLLSSSPEKIAIWVNDAQRNMGAKCKALRKLNELDVTSPLIELKVKASVIEQLRKAVANPVETFRVRENARQELQRWEGSAM